MTRARNPVIPLFLRSSPEHQLFSLLPCFPSPERTVKPPHQQNQVRFRSRGVRVGTHQQVAEPRLGGKRVLTDGQRDGCCCCCFPDAVGEMKGCRRRTRCSARDPTGSELPAGRAGAAGHHFSQRGFCCLCRQTLSFRIHFLFGALEFPPFNIIEFLFVNSAGDLSLQTIFVFPGACPESGPVSQARVRRGSKTTVCGSGSVAPPDGSSGNAST
ncbi:hypothetical protein FQA47_021792 [Oryzias melastigma]|uniref:Uncharacterized protein n=1 Tax=Oryzias melastigma TaxID=30732 RepID=A0A834L0S5_ORYME|nr:hypothetical protein FQA47_021792 [Oryzias melastigma]